MRRLMTILSLTEKRAMMKSYQVDLYFKPRKQR